MPKYLVSGSYVGEGVKGLLKDGGTSRKEAVENLIEGLGGKVEAMYFAFGNEDFFIIADMPDNVKTAAGALIAKSTGAVSNKITVLLTPEELDQVSKISVDYRKPGQ
jgi:uncharacterized protein with GYD domain